jgi:CubicO group peptidase (beta-lactamase class C family)
MESTVITLSPELKKRLAAGHNEARQPAANWDFTSLAGAGAIRSDVSDMLTLVAANLGYVDSPLAKAMAAMTKVRRPGPVNDIEIALAWHVTQRGDREIIWHNGGTGGCRCWIGFDPKARHGVVVLSNMSTVAGVDDIGLHLVDSSAPLAKFTPTKAHQEITLDPKVLETYLGVYQFAPGITLTITRAGGQMYAQLTNQPKLEIYRRGRARLLPEGGGRAAHLRTGRGHLAPERPRPARPETLGATSSPGGPGRMPSQYRA